MTDTNRSTGPSESPRVPWFGSKRIGWGIRPQTWQGWAVVIAFAAACVLVGWLLTGRP